MSFKNEGVKAPVGVTAEGTSAVVARGLSTLRPPTDIGVNFGTSSFRFNQVVGVEFLTYNAVGDAQPTANLSSTQLAFGVGGGTPVDTILGRGAANRLDVATGDSLNIVAGDILIGGTVLFEADRDLAVSLIPNADNALTLGSAARRIAEGNGVQWNVFSLVSDANPSVRLSGNSIQLGAGGATALDVQLTRGAANRLDLASGDSFNIVSGDLLFAATIVINSSRNVVGVNALAQALNPDADNTRAFGTASLRYSDMVAVQHRIFAALGDANASARLSSNSLELGAGGATALDVQLTRGAADRLDLATGDTFNIVLGSFQIAATTVFNSSRDLAINLIPDGDNTRSFGSSTRRASELYCVYSVFDRRLFYADQLDNPVNANWIVNALAPVEADPTNAALPIRAFDDTTEEGIGFILSIPSGVTKMRIYLKGRARTAPGAARTVGVKLYYRQIYDNAAVSTTWAGTNDGSKVLADIDIPTNAFFQYDSQTLDLITDFAPDVILGKLYQFELTRINPTAGTELVGDWLPIEIMVEFS